MMKKDPRAIKTETAIIDAFTALIEENGYANVSIKDIAKKAQVNRNTFYLHYKSKEDLTNKLITEAFMSEFGPVMIEQMLTNCVRRRTFRQIFTHVFTVIEQNINLYRLFLIDANLTGHIDKFIKKIHDKLVEILPENKRNQIGVNYILYGIYGVIRRWIIYDLGTIEENVHFLTEFTVGDLRRLLLRTR